MTKRLVVVIEAVTKAGTESMKAATERHMNLEKSQSQAVNSRFKNKVTWGVGGATVLAGVLWAFGVLHAAKGMHLPVSPGVVTGAGTIACGAIVGAASTIWRKIRARIVRLAVSEAMRRDAYARSDTVTPLPVGPQAQPPPEQQGDRTQSDVS